MPPRVKLKLATPPQELEREAPSHFLLYSFLAFLLRLLLILWSFHQDQTPFKYTDVDYNVFTDAARCLVSPNSTDCSHASGPISHLLPSLGDPYARDTYRYTPLVALLAVPNILVHPVFAKLLFSISDLLVGLLLYQLLILPSPSRAATPTSRSTSSKIVASIWLLNPIIANISTRGSAESVLGLIVISTLFLAERKRWDGAAVAFGLAVHFKVFPVIYGSSLIAALSGSGIKKGGIIGTGITRAHVRFVIISAASFMALNAIMYLIWGQPFLSHTFLYHIHRLDHRHNFSPYFYPYYLSEFLPPSSSTPSPLSLIAILRHPLGAFLPQLGLSTILGFAFGKEDLAFAWFLQTFAFVTFNKVCTSQYFLWYLWLLPPILPRLNFTRTRATVLITIWVLSQALWLSQAYRLEMKAESVFLEVWAMGSVFLGVNCGILAEVVGAYYSGYYFTSERIWETGSADNPGRKKVE